VGVGACVAGDARMPLGSGGVEVVSPPEVRADLAVTAAVVARYG